MTLKNTKQQLLMQMMTRVDTIVAMITQANAGETFGKEVHALSKLQNECNLLKINADNLNTWFVEYIHKSKEKQK
ncbi:hypothetical protein [Limosilactobacillus reuteri]|uniref:hypothetical protein n=1 Tax=Limosilactobacillus reuteri TaxID=1598 RepID=UPI00104794FF|nr:hypothetical protein [Limosilactobacillus reuteri]MCC4366117.1 hypothetical protein [Limosilactobacillus reuteri]